MKKFILPILFLLSGVLYAEDYAKYFSVIRDSAGAAVDGATITVYDAGTVNVSTIYSDSVGTPKGNPFLSDAQGNYEFFASPGLYKISVTKLGVGTFTTDNVQVGTALHASRHEDGGEDALDVSSVSGTHPDAQKVAVEANGVASDTENTIDFVDSSTTAPVVTPGTGKVTVGFDVQNDTINEDHLEEDSVGTSELAVSAVYNENVSATAAIAESKLALNYPTHSNTNDPTANQKAAMAGTFGSPNGTNRFVTDQDSRMTNSRTPSAHAATHGNGQSDEVSIDVTQITTGVDAGTDLTADLEEETHATEHQNGGADEISVAGLSGELADAQPVDVSLGGTLVGTRSKINLIEGGNAFLTVADNPGSDRVDVTIAGIGAASMTVAESDADPSVAAVNKINFDQADGFTVTDDGSGEVTIGVTAGSSLTVQESDTAPSVVDVNTINFDQADGFTITDDGLGVVTVGVTAGSALTVQESDLDPSVSSVSTISLSGCTVTDNTGGAVTITCSSSSPWTDNGTTLTPGAGELVIANGTPIGSSIASGTLSVNPASVSSSEAVVWSDKNAWDSGDLGNDIGIALVDIDKDGDLDLFIGNNTSGGNAYENTGTSLSPIWTNKDSWDLPDVGNSMSASFGDLDGDGDYDVLIGADVGVSYAYKNTGSETAPTWSAEATWNVPDVGNYSKPTLGDLDGDGDLDVLVGEENYVSKAYQNTGSVSSPTWAANITWNAPNVGCGGRAHPALADLDSDGDLDVIIGNKGCAPKAYENIGGTASPMWSAKTAWDALDPGSYLSIALGDIDGDGDYDAMIGENTGVAYGAENTGAVGANSNTLFGVGINDTDKFRVSGIGATLNGYFDNTYSGDVPAMKTRQNGTGPVLSAYANTTPVFIVLKNGRVGIGDQTPDALLDVAGEMRADGVSGDGSGKLVCIKADGDFGTCSDAPGAGGTCTCG